ncbi:MAG: hypothetical protein M3Q06_00305 [Bacteroidota bacterium]|nr:hypothetical protein [Bacteroidota bacterium]
MRVTIPFFCLCFIFPFSDASGQTGLKVGDSVEVTNIGKGVIVGGFQKSEFNYGTYQVHLDGEKYCNNHSLDTRYNEAYVVPQKKPATKTVADEQTKDKNAGKPQREATAGEFKVGDTVLYSQTSIWSKGVIKSYDPVNRRYTLQDVYVGIPCYAVAKWGQAYSNNFFIGQWNVYVSGANYTTINDGKVFDNVSGGMKLFPLLINKNGTYAWRVSVGKTLNGRWKPREDAPGIIILNGIDGKDWTVYETTEGFATTKNTKDEIRFHHMPSNTGYYLATRVGANKSCLLTGRTF